jgi:hypothetical protein
MSNSFECHNFDCTSGTILQTHTPVRSSPLIKFYFPPPESSSEGSVSSAEGSSVGETSKFPFVFHLPPPDSSSSSNSTDSSVLSSKAVICHSAISVADVPTIIGAPTVTRTSSSISPTYQLKQIWTQQLQHSVDSKVLTPLCSNRAYVKQPAVIQAEKELSPLNCTCLKYSSVDCSLEVAHEISPVVVRSRVPKGYQVMDDDYSLLEYPDSEVEGDESSLNECTVVDSIEPAVLVQVETLDLNAMAKSITDDALDPNISEEELKLIMSSSVNTKV